jgi:hypothetical protein
MGTILRPDTLCPNGTPGTGTSMPLGMGCSGPDGSDADGGRARSGLAH